MTVNALLQFSALLLLLIALIKPLGWYVAQICQGKPALVNQWLAPVEQGIYRLCGIDPKQTMSWKQFALSLLCLNILGVLVVYGLQRTQAYLPLNPEHFANVRLDTAFNTAISFATQTNWQSYAGENSLSYLTQMLALTVQNFLACATAITVLLAFIRGLARNLSDDIGNYWVDMTRITLYLLLPLSLLFAILLMGQGVIQNFNPYQKVSTQNQPTQVIPMGPVASQEAIKILGTNGGGFFQANSAHPFENPTPLSNFLQMLAILLIPASLCYTFGVLVGDTRQGWTLLAMMFIVFIFMACAVIYAEQQGNPVLTQLTGGNMEGKETRFGITDSALFASITTAASCGAVNAMMDSFTPLGGLIPLWLIQMGEIIFGGAGSGLYSLLIYALLAVFLAGLMIGRTPQYLGKKIGPFEIKMVSIVLLIPPILILGGSALGVSTIAGRAGIFNPGTHGFTEILYAFSSTANNNGSAFAGLSANTLFYNILFGIIMAIKKFGSILAILAIAGSLAAKKRLRTTSASLPTHGILFIFMIIGTVILIDILTFFPSLALGPLAEWMSQ